VYILDSDTLDCYVHHQGRFPTLQQRILSTPFERLFISVITLEEAINGAMKFKGRDILRYYEILATVLPAYCRFNVLPYDRGARLIYDRFDRNTLKIGKNDCKIGATAILRGFTVVTRNVIDFSRIPDVKSEDWTR
jgi:tRNA(fMet)-specific endonuclease VapC